MTDAPKPGPRPGPGAFPKPGPRPGPAGASPTPNTQASDTAEVSAVDAAPEQTSDAEAANTSAPSPKRAGDTGNADVDAAMGALADLEDDDLANHHDRLATAHEALHRTLSQARPDQA